MHLCYEADIYIYLYLLFQVILMSATMDSQLFANYFPTPFQDKLIPAPVLRIEGRMHIVQEFFMDDLRALGEVGICTWVKQSW